MHGFYRAPCRHAATHSGFVSHGGEAFPSLIFVLQGYGVTEDLVGTTFISKAGITSSTFKAVPDVPIGTFELTLPQEPYSALAANLPAVDRGSFCGQKLALPTAFVGQNGAEIHESTPLSVSGCKPAITVVKHSVKGETATIVVSVPAAGQARRHRIGPVPGERQGEQGRHGDGETDSDEGRGGLSGQAPRSQAEGQDQPAVHPQEGKQADDQRDSPDRLSTQVLSTGPPSLAGGVRGVPPNGAQPLRAGFPSWAPRLSPTAAAPLSGLVAPWAAPVAVQSA